MSADEKADSVAELDADSPDYSEKTTVLESILDLVWKKPRGESLVPTLEPIVLKRNVRISWSEHPFKLTLGNVALEFHPDLPIGNGVGAGRREWVVHSGPDFYASVPRFVRVTPGKPVLFGRSDKLQHEIFQFDNTVADRHVRIFNHRGNLTVQLLEFERPATISAIDGPRTTWTLRRENLMRLRSVLENPLVPFDDEEAFEKASQLNSVLATEAYREPDDDGTPGGILQLPDEMTVVLMGDLHACADNLLRVLSEGGLLGALERNEACLVLLGDLVHSQESGELADMDSSVVILDLFTALKLRFPKNIFCLRGNHESFSPDVLKGGVPQGLFFRKHLKKLRGKAYVAEIETFFEGLAFIVQGNDFAACHGAPVRSRVNRSTLVNIRRYPGIQYEIVWNRLRRGNRPAGYGKGSVKRFRRTLNLTKHAPMIVGHTPLSAEETVWLDVGGIKGHHVVYSANPDRVAAFVMCKGQATPLEFWPEPVLAFLDGEVDA